MKASPMSFVIPMKFINFVGKKIYSSGQYILFITNNGVYNIKIFCHDKEQQNRFFSYKLR